MLFTQLWIYYCTLDQIKKFRKTIIPPHLPWCGSHQFGMHPVHTGPPFSMHRVHTGCLSFWCLLVPMPSQPSDRWFFSKHSKKVEKLISLNFCCSSCCSEMSSTNWVRLDRHSTKLCLIRYQQSNSSRELNKVRGNIAPDFFFEVAGWVPRLQGHP